MTLYSHVKTMLEHYFPSVYASLLTLRTRLRPTAGEAELALLPTLCPSNEIAIDVGANGGDYSAALVQLARHVIAIEPNPNLVHVLKARLAREIRAGRLSVIEAALGANGPEVANLFIPDISSELASIGTPPAKMPGKIIRVPLRRLDDLVGKEAIGFIKIDVEGHEASVLRGARDLIAGCRPTLLIEIEERHHAGALDEVRGLLEPSGYHGFYLHAGSIEPIESFDSQRLQNQSALEPTGMHRLRGSTYVNNFIFAARLEVLRSMRSMRLGRSALP
jgi:FkbM family methyltransferase